MRALHVAILLMLLLAGAAIPRASYGQEGALEKTQEETNSCMVCHLELGDEMAEPVKGMEHDVHAQNGLTCVACHGGDDKAGFDGDMDEAMDPAKGYIGAPERKDIPGFCARCHSDPTYMRQYNPRVSTDQFDRYKTSVHGQLLTKGDGKVATCIDCHGVHGIRKISDPRSSVYTLNIPSTCGHCHANAEYMQEYGIPTDQVEKFKISVHGMALLEKGDQAAPACNDCHGNHGASPPGTPSIAFVCGQCHLNNSELFNQSPHRAAFDEMDLPECETCHGNHEILHPADNLLGTGENAICVQCHDEGDKGYEVAGLLFSEIDTLKTEISVADAVIKKARRAGMEVSEGTFNLRDANDFLIKSRTLVHAFSVEKLDDEVKQGRTVAEKAYEIGVAALRELQFRRKGLALSIVFILLLAVGLYFKIKDVDQKNPIVDYTEK